MNNIQKKVIASAVLAVTLLSAPAYAFFGVATVIDPSNLVQNTSSALAAVRNEINTSTALIHQIQSAINTTKSLTSVKGLATLAGLQQELANYRKLKATSTQLAGLVQQSLNISKNLEAQFGASSMSLKDFLASTSSLRKKTAASLSEQYETVDNSMAEVAERRKAIVNSLQGSQGQTAALMNVGAGIDALIGQNQTMISMLQAQGKAGQAYKNSEEADAKKEMEQRALRQQRMIDAAAKYEVK